MGSRRREDGPIQMIMAVRLLGGRAGTSPDFRSAR